MYILYLSVYMYVVDKVLFVGLGLQLNSAKVLLSESTQLIHMYVLKKKNTQ